MVINMNNPQNSIFYSIIIVCLDAGERLKNTVKSVLSQSYDNYEIVVKDGGSKDGSVEYLSKNIDSDKLRIYNKKDKSIYDAMNQAIELSKGEYFIFLNAGDSFYDENVLKNITQGIADKKNEINKLPDIVYGNMYHKALDTIIYPSPVINDFACYRNVPCHQTCFYHKSMFNDRGYNIKYNVRADYEHFLWCFYEKQAKIYYLPVMTAAYEGGGYSETKENKKLSAMQHREIVVKYMGKAKANKYRLMLFLTFAPLRSAMADSRYFSSFYNAIKTFIYKVKG